MHQDELISLQEQQKYTPGKKCLHTYSMATKTAIGNFTGMTYRGQQYKTENCGGKKS
jgi:hypothetical protein